MLLAMDTATDAFSLALHDGDTLLAEDSYASAGNPTVELAPAVRAMLARCGVAPGALKGIAVCVGPGLYGGLRACAAFAKGLAVAHNLPVVGISSLDIFAAGAPYAHGALIAAVNAGRGRIAVGRYQWRKNRWTGRGEPQLMDWDTLFASVDGAAHLTGEIDAAGRESLKVAAMNGYAISLVPAVYRLRRAGFLAEEAWSRLRDGQLTFPAGDLALISLKADRA